MDQSEKMEVAIRKSDRLDRKRSGCEGTARDYVLDKKRALEKKMLSCMNDTKIEYIPKDNNHIYTMSTAMYELYKLEIMNFYECRAEADEHNLKVKMSNIFDKNRACVETQIKVHQKTQRGCGKLKFTLNLYHTASRIMANGKNTELFLKHHDEVVRSILSKKEIKDLDKRIFSAVEAELRKISCAPPSKVPTPSRSGATGSGNPSRSGRTVLDNPNKPIKPIDTPREIEGDRVTSDECSNADALDYCPWCKEKVGDLKGGICCENCLQWLHFCCEGITEEDFENTETDQPYVCKTCQLESSLNFTDSILHDGMRDDETDQKDDILEKACMGRNSPLPIQADPIIVEDDPEDVAGSRQVVNHTRDSTPQSCVTSHEQKRDTVVPPTGADMSIQAFSRGPNNLPSPVQKKPSKPKKGKKPEVPNPSEDQLKLAQSYIVTLEHKINDLEDSNSLLKQELKYSGKAPNDPVTNSRQVDGVSQAGSSFTCGISGNNDTSGLRERINSIEMELMKSRLNSLEMLVSRIAHMPSAHIPPVHIPGLQFPVGPPVHGMMPPPHVPYHTYVQMPVGLPYTGHMQPHTLPGNMFHPTQSQFNQIPVMTHAVPPRPVNPYLGRRLNMNHTRPLQPHTRVPDGNRSESEAGNFTHSAMDTTHRSSRTTSAVTTEDDSHSPSDSTRKDENIATLNRTVERRPDHNPLPGVHTNSRNSSMKGVSPERLADYRQIDGNCATATVPKVALQTEKVNAHSDSVSFLCTGRASPLTWRKKRLSL